MKESVSLEPETLLAAYAQGAFPMADCDGRIRWYTAEPRGIIPLHAFHVPKSLGQVVAQSRFEVRINSDFEATMRACMEARRGETWINEELIAAYCQLRELGFAHSVECWQRGELVGGLYGVSLGGAFFGESMFHKARDASKVALVHLVNRLNDRGYDLLDTQATTSHLRQFGCIDVPAEQYLRRLKKALKHPCSFE